MRNVIIKDFCMVVEVKKHDIENLSFQGSELLVEYRNGNHHNASQQNRNQVYSLINYLDLKGTLNVSNHFSTKSFKLNSYTIFRPSMIWSQYILSDSSLDVFVLHDLSQNKAFSFYKEGPFLCLQPLMHR
jgi:hypothetical protein